MNTFSRFFGGLLKKQPSLTLPVIPAPLPAEATLREGSRSYHRLVDPDTVIAAIGDIHGRLDLLEELCGELDELSQTGRRNIVEIYLGDFVDHAGEPRTTLEYLMERRLRTDRQVICLAGNHEQMFQMALEQFDYFVKWLRFGGDTTLKSYVGSEPGTLRSLEKAFEALRASVPETHRKFLLDLPTNFEFEDFYFVHAGVNPTKPLSEQTIQDKLWIRDPFLSSTANFGKVVVHGHTPVLRADVRRNRIGIDTGAYLTGRLSCLLLSSDGLRIKATHGQRRVAAFA